MPRPTIDPVYRTLAFNIWGENPRTSAAAVCRELERFAARERRPDAPSMTTVRRLRAEFRALSITEQRDYGPARWPDAMESGALPWEASASLMELLAHALPKGSPPLVRLARWHYRVSLAAPDAPWNERLRVSGHLAAFELLGPIPHEERRAAEGYLAFKPWTEQGAAVYERLVNEGKLIDLRNRGIEMTTETPRDITTAVFAMWIPGLWVSIRNTRILEPDVEGLAEDVLGGPEP